MKAVIAVAVSLAGCAADDLAAKIQKECLALVDLANRDTSGEPAAPTEYTEAALTARGAKLPPTPVLEQRSEIS